MGEKFWKTFYFSNTAIALFLVIDGAFLFLYAQTLGVSASEARQFFYGEDAIGKLLRFSVSILGQNNVGIRAPFILAHLINTALVYVVAREHVRRSDAVIAMLLFMLLPGINSAALLVSSAPFIMCAALLCVWLYSRSEILAIALLFALAMIDNIFIVLNLAVACFEIYKKRYRIAVLLFLFMTLSYVFYGFEVSGRPRGYFPDIFGLYGAIFSPFVFCFFVYTIYWGIFKSSERLSLLWFVSSVAFMLSIVLSLRQNLPIEDYAPFAAIGAPLIVKAFMNSWRIRLPQFRKGYITLAAVMIGSLLLFDALIFVHKPLYILMSKSGKHFAREHHFVGELASRLKAMGIDSIECDSERLAARLKFYGIASGGDHAITRNKPSGESIELTFDVLGYTAATYYLSPK
ncbi:MAG: glycosyltransferase family 39 protein [Helicobacteraceae bacterium]|jgi:hypothetical protein|nr:glycosyltransferase family 39 protein [Helicobacteraceae bacterium]